MVTPPQPPPLEASNGDFLVPCGPPWQEDSRFSPNPPPQVALLLTMLFSLQYNVPHFHNVIVPFFLISLTRGRGNITHYRSVPVFPSHVAPHD